MIPVRPCISLKLKFQAVLVIGTRGAYSLALIGMVPYSMQASETEAFWL